MPLFRRKKFEVKPERIAESSQSLVNPGCGWYRPYIFRLEEEVDPAYLETVIVPEEKLCLVEIALYHYKNIAIDQEGRERIRTIMKFFADHDRDIILRFAYDIDGKALEHEPLRMELIFSHMASASELIEPWRDRVILMQGLFTGNWGEMHGSRFMTPHLLRELYDYYRMEFGRDMTLAVRRPSYLRLLSGESLRDPHLTVYNDAILASLTDLGTYGHEEGWTDEWKREKELDFISKECATRPVGGEVIRPQHAPEGDVDEKDIIHTLEQMRLSYLNSQYDKKAFEKWKRLPASKNSIPGVSNMYDEISLRIGYRFVIQRVSIESGRRDDHYIRVLVYNRGFAASSEPLAAILKIGDRQHRLSISSQTLMPGRQSGLEFNLPNDLQPGTYPLQLRLERASDGCTVHFANEGWEDEESVSIGVLIRK